MRAREKEKGKEKGARKKKHFKICSLPYSTSTFSRDLAIVCLSHIFLFLQQNTEEELALLAADRHLPTYPHIPVSGHHGNTAAAPPLGPTPSVLLQEPSVHPIPHDVYVSGCTIKTCCILFSVKTSAKTTCGWLRSKWSLILGVVLALKQSSSGV